MKRFIDIQSEPRDEFQRSKNLQVEGGKNISCIARIDTGYPITIILKNLIKYVDIKTPDVKSGIDIVILMTLN